MEICSNTKWRSDYMTQGPASWLSVILPLRFPLGSNEQKPYTGSQYLTAGQGLELHAGALSGRKTSVVWRLHKSFYRRQGIRAPHPTGHKQASWKEGMLLEDPRPQTPRPPLKAPSTFLPDIWSWPESLDCFQCFQQYLINHFTIKKDTKKFCRDSYTNTPRFFHPLLWKLKLYFKKRILGPRVIKH